MYGTLFLRCECKKIATFMKMTNSGQWMIPFLETPSVIPQEFRSVIMLNDHPCCYYTMVPHFYNHIEINDHVLSSNIKPSTLMEIEENLFCQLKNWT